MSAWAGLVDGLTPVKHSSGESYYLADDAVTIVGRATAMAIAIDGLEAFEFLPPRTVQVIGVLGSEHRMLSSGKPWPEIVTVVNANALTFIHQHQRNVDRKSVVFTMIGYRTPSDMDVV